MLGWFLLVSFMGAVSAISDFEVLVFRVVFSQDTERFHSDMLETTPFAGSRALSEENSDPTQGVICVADSLDDILINCQGVAFPTSANEGNVRLPAYLDLIHSIQFDPRL